MSGQNNLQTIKGFQELYPADRAVQSYVLEKARAISKLFGFEEYDGPILEPIELYLNKSSQELVEEQSFMVIDKKGNKLLLRPEMTPTLARMVASKENELIFPIRYFNSGLRYRYEAPQKGREREFYQMDFDIIGSENEIADVELLAIVVELMKSFGATEKDFRLCINSRSILTDTLAEYGISQDQAKKVIKIIDKKEKISDEQFNINLTECGLSQEQRNSIMSIFTNTNDYTKKFQSFLSRIREYGIEEYIDVDPTIVRGLDYYTGLIFEVKSTGEMVRSLFGGGRYDNLLEGSGAKQKLPGLGFATSDSSLIAFLEEKNLLPTVQTVPTQVLVTIFDADAEESSIKTATMLRNQSIATELYPSNNEKLAKQIKYADRKGIPFVLVIGPDEKTNNVVMLKNMKTGEQNTVSLEDAVAQITSYGKS